MITVYLGVAALLVWVGFELIFRTPGEASSWRGDARDRTSTPLLLVAFAVAAILPAALRGVAFGSVGQAGGVGRRGSIHPWLGRPLLGDGDAGWVVHAPLVLCAVAAGDYHPRMELHRSAAQKETPRVRTTFRRRLHTRVTVAGRGQPDRRERRSGRLPVLERI
jgi:hypothetical protein